MPPFLALILWFLLLSALLFFDPAKKSRSSFALWVPFTWMFIVASRLPSQWLGNQMYSTTQGLEEGNSLDRVIYSALILLAIGILMLRSFNWSGFVVRNSLLIALLGFGLISAVWSDFPFVSFKRWSRDLGNYLMVLVVLSDAQPLEAVQTLLRRLSYSLIPLSIVLIKYYPQTGKLYDFWNGASMFVGATTSKNMLGVLCLISGIFFFWDTLTRWPDRKQGRGKLIIWLNLVLFAMTLWLLNLSNSATSRVCLLLGCLVITVANRKVIKRNPSLLTVSIPVCLCLYMALQYLFDINGGLAAMVGRDPTLTGRTNIWNAVLNVHTNPLLGTGYDSFWLGPRLQQVWRQTGNGINEAHNGYLEVYLNLGLIGVFLLGGFLIASYRAICKRLRPFSSFGSLSLALWTVLLFYNATEAAFRGQLMWVVFLLGAIVTPQASSGRSISRVERPQLEEQQPKLQETVTI